MVALDIKEVPGSCGECPIRVTDQDCYAVWCAVLDKEINNDDKKLRGCPIKGKVRKCDVIREIKGK